MATSGELRAIIQELQLVDIGDAASYLGEEATVEEESSIPVETFALLTTHANHLAAYDCTLCPLHQV